MFYDIMSDIILFAVNNCVLDIGLPSITTNCHVII